MEVIYTAKKCHVFKVDKNNVFNNIVEPGSGISMTMLNQILLRTMRPAWIAQHRPIMFSST